MDWNNGHNDGIPLIELNDVAVEANGFAPPPALEKAMAHGAMAHGAMAHGAMAHGAMAQPINEQPSGLLCNMPYHLETALFGRQGELTELSNWFTIDEDNPVCLLTGIGGVGKSALAWQWARQVSQSQVKTPVLWWQWGEEEATFAAFLATLLQHFGEDAGIYSHPRQRLDRVLYHLQRRPIVIILDNAETILQVYESSPESDAGILLRRIANNDYTAAKLILISQWLPNSLHLTLPAGYRRLHIGNVCPQDAFYTFNQLGLRVPLSKVIEVGEWLHYHPYSLRLLAGAALTNGGMVNIAGKFSLDGLPVDWRNIVDWAYQNLPFSTQLILRNLGENPHNLTRKGIYQRFSSATLDEDLSRLTQAGFLGEVQYQRDTFYTIPRTIRRFLAALPLPLLEGEVVEGEVPAFFPNRSSAVREYRQLIQAQQYDQALAIYRGHLIGWLAHNSSGKESEIELLRCLFPAEPGALPQVTRVEDQAWALTQLAERQGLNGRPRIAISLLEQSNTLYQQLLDKTAYANGLTLLAKQQKAVGSLSAADYTLRQALAVYAESNDLVGEAEARSNLAAIQAVCGNWTIAARELDSALEAAEESAHLQLQSNIWAAGAWMALLQGEAEAGLISAQEAFRMLQDKGATTPLVSIDYVRLHWLLGWAQTLLVDFGLAKLHLDEALRQAAAIGYVSLQPAILLARARLAYAQWQENSSYEILDSAQKIAEEAVNISQRAGFLLDMADGHNVLALLAMENGESTQVLNHANEAYHFAQCDGAPFTYAIAQDVASKMIAK